MKLRALALAGTILSLAAIPASAHHSFAMFDREKTVTITGTVKEFDWINPHSWLQVMVPDAQGQIAAWSLEMGGPGQMARMGWDSQTLKPGDKVSVTIHPLKDGSYGGQLLSVMLPNGETLGQFGRGRGFPPRNS